MVRARRGALERVVLFPFPFLRPFRCPGCGSRKLRSLLRLDRVALLFLLLSLLLGIVLIQAIWAFRSGARRYESGYEPKDLERQQFLENRPR